MCFPSRRRGPVLVPLLAVPLGQPAAVEEFFLGQVLQRNGSGKLWEAVILDPDSDAVASLQYADGVSDFEQSPLTLEEAYCALLARKEEQP